MNEVFWTLSVNALPKLLTNEVASRKHHRKWRLYRNYGLSYPRPDCSNFKERHLKKWFFVVWYTRRLSRRPNSCVCEERWMLPHSSGYVLREFGWSFISQVTYGKYTCLGTAFVDRNFARRILILSRTSEKTKYWSRKSHSKEWPFWEELLWIASDCLHDVAGNDFVWHLK